jgi:hypothetical protein
MRLYQLQCADIFNRVFCSRQIASVLIALRPKGSVIVLDVSLFAV